MRIRKDLLVCILNKGAVGGPNSPWLRKSRTHHLYHWRHSSANEQMHLNKAEAEGRLPSRGFVYTLSTFANILVYIFRTLNTNFKLYCVFETVLWKFFLWIKENIILKTSLNSLKYFLKPTQINCVKANVIILFLCTSWALATYEESLKIISLQIISPDLYLPNF